MELKPIVNRKMIMKNRETKAVWKAARRYYDHRNRQDKSLKSTLFKVVVPASDRNDIVNMTNIPTESLLGKSSTANTSTQPLTKEQFLTLIQDTSLTGMSGNGFSVSQKIEALISACNDQTKSLLLINGVECEPGLIHDEWLMRTHFDEIRQCIHTIASILEIKRSIFAVKAVRRPNETALPASDQSLEVYPVPARYPAGEEHFLIRTVLGIEIPKDQPPVNDGILVMNIQTIWQISRIINGTYDGGRFMTVADLSSGQAKPAYVMPDTKINALLQKAFGDKGFSRSCYMGAGVMTACPASESDSCGIQLGLAAYLPKTYEGILSNQNRCKGCGACSRKCPMGIDVKSIIARKEKDPNADISAFHPETCIHCGSCTWYCHANKLPGAYM